MLNRKNPPTYLPVRELQNRPFQKERFSSGTDVYVLSDTETPLLKLEFFYSGAALIEPLPGHAQALSGLLLEGTQTKTAEEIANAFDQLGAFVQCSSNRDDISIVIHVVAKHVVPCIQLLEEVLTTYLYPENELFTYKMNAIQSIAVKEQKTSYLAKQKLNLLLWGNEHPYGAPVNQGVIQNISRETLLAYARSVFAYSPTTVFVTGNYTRDAANALRSLISRFNTVFCHKDFSKPNPRVSLGLERVHKDGATQCSLRMGKHIIGREHPDYREFTVLNMLLGGFFGSRLMKNIREDKGLTYGIYSSIENHRCGNIHMISVELNQSLVMEGKAEIEKELKRLRTELVEEEELSLVKNYYLGAFLRGFDGLFSLSVYAKICADNNLSSTYFSDYVSVINNINASRIRELAEQYIDEQSYLSVVSGPAHV